MLKNKKGSESIATLVLVLFSVTLCGIAIYTFLSSNDKLAAKINDAGFLNEVYGKEEIINFEINNFVDRAAYESYQEMLTSYVELDSGGNVVLEMFDNENFESKFLEKLRAKVIEKIKNSQNEDFSELLKNVEKIKTEITEGIIKVEVPDFYIHYRKVETEQKQVYIAWIIPSGYSAPSTTDRAFVIYKTNLSIRYNMSYNNLPWFAELKEKTKKCEVKLEGFESIIDNKYSDDSCLIKLKSKRVFIVNGQEERLEFGLTVKKL